MSEYEPTQSRSTDQIADQVRAAQASAPAVPAATAPIAPAATPEPTVARPWMRVTEFMPDDRLKRLAAEAALDK